MSPHRIASPKTVSKRPTAGARTGAAYHHGDLKHALKAAALEVLAGPEAHLLSFRELARHLGVTTGAPYFHFKDRTHLLISLAIDGFNRLHDKMQAAAAAASSDDSLVRVLTLAYLNFAREDWGYYQAMFLPEVAAAKDVPELREAANRSFHLVRDTLAALEERLTMEEASARAVSLWSLLHGMIHLRAAGTLGRRLPIEHEDEFAVEAVQRLLA